MDRQLASPARSDAHIAELRKAGAAGMVNPVLIDPESSLQLIPFGEVIVCLKDEIDPASYFGAAFGKATPLPGTTRQFIVVLDSPDFEATVTALQKYADSPEVAWAEPNFILESRPAFIPTDPLYSDQWHLGGDTSGLIGYNRADVSAETAWDTTFGKPDVVVAIIDDAFDIDHEDLAPNLFVNSGEIPGDGIDNDGNGYVDDVNGYNFFLRTNNVRPTAAGSAFGTSINHGTAVAGVAIARGNNGIGVAGIAFRSGFMPVNLAGSSADKAAMIRYCAGLTGTGWRGADILSMSYSSSQAAAVDSAFADAARRGRQGRGCVMLAAAGNGAGGWFDVRLPLPAGTHNFEWRYTKNGSGTAGGDAVWIDDVTFWSTTSNGSIPEYGSEGFGDGAPGFTSGGAVNWGFHTGSDRASGILDSTSVRSGAIGDNQTSSLYYTKTVPVGVQMRFKVRVESASGDFFQFYLDGALQMTASGVPTIGQSLFTSSARSYPTNSVIGFQNVFASTSAYQIAPSYPANNTDVICVGASSDYDLRSEYSQYGTKLEIVAPSSGGDLGIVTTDRSTTVGGDPGYSSGNYDHFRTEGGFGGTSSATPLAAGVAALALSVNPWMTATQVRSLLRGTADKIGKVTYDTNGFNQYHGYGRVNAAKAVQAARGTQYGFFPYTQNFNSATNGATDLGDGSSLYSNLGDATASVQGGALQLTVDGTGNTFSAYVLPKLGRFEAEAFIATFRYRIPEKFGFTADGFSFNYGPLRDGINVGEDGFNKGLSVQFRTYRTDFGTWDQAEHRIEVNGIIIPGGQIPTDPFRDGLWHDVRIAWHKTAGTGLTGPVRGTVSLSVDNRAIFRELATDFAPDPDDTFAFAARTGGESETLLIDDVRVEPDNPSGFHQNYEGFPLQATALGDGSSSFSTAPNIVGVDVVGDQVGYRLAKNGVYYNLSAYVLPPLGPATHQGFEARFRYYMASTDATPADGFAFNYGDWPADNHGENGLGTGLAVGFNLYSTHSHNIFVDGTQIVGGTNPAWPFVDGQWHAVVIRWERTGTGGGLLTLTVDGTALFNQLFTGSFNPDGSERFVFTGRTGGLSADILLDDVQVTPLQTPPYDIEPFRMRRLSSPSPTVGAFGMSWASSLGFNYELQTSSDLTNWTTLFTRPGVEGIDGVTLIVSFTDHPKQFYRVVRP
jgi:hypothetical protein